MLELIVLGEIPGTGIVVTFQWALIATIVFVGSTLIYFLHKRRLALMVSPQNEAKA